MASSSRILVINPNSSQSVTDGLVESLTPLSPPQTTLSFYTAPATAPLSIDDITTATLSAAECMVDINAKGLLDQYDGFLICCFSDHPLVHMLHERTLKPCIGILQAAITQALLVGNRFGILATGSGYMYDRVWEIQAVLGGPSTRFAGLEMSGLGVVELREGDRAYVEKSIKETSVRIAAAGADVVILGCAGMTGMEGLVEEAVGQASLRPVRVVDGAKAGVQFLAGLVRLSR
ncbi:Asp/Glu/hydantoin racemase [Infundibulicybe gibba]|nr:Asp/Glu/hydantoin racemase [Infundibulicybe gibba]